MGVRVCACAPECSHLPEVFGDVQLDLEEGALGGRRVGVDGPQPLQGHNLVERGVARSILDDVELQGGAGNEQRGSWW